MALKHGDVSSLILTGWNKILMIGNLRLDSVPRHHETLHHRVPGYLREFEVRIYSAGIRS